VLGPYAVEARLGHHLPRQFFTPHGAQAHPP
jgi:hypothetical protein